MCYSSSNEFVKMSQRKGIILDKSFNFAIEVVKMYQRLCDEKREYVMSKQLLRSGTAVGALVREAQNAESRADFIHKLSIAQKECDETVYWLELLKKLNTSEKKILSTSGIWRKNS